MSWQTWRALVAVGCAGLLAGCGDGGKAGLSGPRAGGPGKRVHLIGFDASEPVVTGLRQGSIDGVVLQNPLKMGDLGVKTLVKYLEKQPVERRISTGEALATPENMDTPDIKSLLFAPKADNVSGSLSDAKSKKWRVMIIPKETTQEFWMTVHAGALKAEKELGNVEVVWQGPQKEDDRVQQIQLVQSAVAAGVDGIVLAPLDARAGVTRGDSGCQANPCRRDRLGAGIHETSELHFDGQLSWRGTRRRADGKAARWRGQGYPLAVRSGFGEHGAT